MLKQPLLQIVGTAGMGLYTCHTSVRASVGLYIRPSVPSLLWARRPADIDCCPAGTQQQTYGKCHIVSARRQTCLKVFIYRNFFF